ncbi:hypothetical protein [Arcobacter sp. LA11]|uniref:hypothetical protein n=1 Tax=Arcobacter sp. LA11 TaxID=1898176 RepID=UPI000934C5F9|nr:hypothetical protein [Arcobacter sp. LA11]
MNMKEKSKEEQLDYAKNSVCEKELWDLHKSSYMNVRRAVARNTNITQRIANNLSVDPVLNVSYMALKNSKSTILRDFSHLSLSPCILCEKDERYLDCNSCPEKRKFR